MTTQSAETQGRNAPASSAVAESGHRDLVIFTGTHKTGSTALHRYLAANRRILAEFGVRYESLGFEQDFIGNGRSLFDMLFLQQPISTEIDKTGPAGVSENGLSSRRIAAVYHGACASSPQGQWRIR